MATNNANESAVNHDVTAIVLCGGSGRRLGGRDKPLIEVGGQTLVERVISRILPQVDSLVLSCRQNTAGYAHLGYPVVTDRLDDGGPLAGIEAALGQIATRFAVICPGDAPAFPADLVAMLYAGMTDSGVVYARHGRNDQFLFMLIHRDLQKNLHTWLKRGGRKVGDWLHEQGAVAVDFPAAARFDNINLPEDLQRWCDETPNT